MIPDRVECLYNLSKLILSSSGIKINKHLNSSQVTIYPAQQFERGNGACKGEERLSVEGVDAKSYMH